MSIFAPASAKVCAAIIGHTPAEMLEKAALAAKETPFLEFRLDYLDKPALALPKLKQFLADNTAVTAIATCRRAANGGKFAGTDAEELDLLLKAAESGCHLVDLELESAETLKPHRPHQAPRDPRRPHRFLARLHTNRATSTPSTSASSPSTPTSSRSSPTAKSLTDNVTLMRFHRAHLRQRFHHRRVHGRRRHHFPRARLACRFRVHLRRGDARGRNRSRPDCRPHPHRDLPHPRSRRIDQGPTVLPAIR